MVDYNIAIPQQQLFQAPDVMQNAMRMQQMQTQDASAQSANQLRAMQTRGLEQGQQLTAIQIQAARQNMAAAAATAREQAAARARAAGDQNALLRAIQGSVVGDTGPLPGPDLRLAANRLAAVGKLGPAATALGAAETFTKADKANADLTKAGIENLDKHYGVFRLFAQQVKTPEDAGVYVDALYSHPEIGKLMAQSGRTREQAIEQAMQQFTDNPKQWTAANVGLSAQQAVDTLKIMQKETDLGGQISTQDYNYFGEREGAPRLRDKTMTPKEAASIETPEQKLAFQADLQRQKTQIDKETAAVETSKQLTTAIKELENASKPGGLIEQSTGSGFGAGVDATAGFFGIGTSGARAIGQLQPIADLVLKMVPRFEGPQSNADVESYNRAAGQIADRNVPNSVRIDAAKTLIRLMKERKDQFVMQGGGAAPSKVVNFGDLK